MGLQAENILDHVKMTNRDFGKYRWTDISYDLQEYIALPELLQKHRVKFKSGEQLQFNVRTATSGASKNVGLYNTDSIAKSDHMQQGLIPWRHSQTNWALDERQLGMNREPARIIDEVQEARTDSMVDMAKLMEDNWWNRPATSDDTDMPYGIKYWITRHITGTSASGAIPGGFNGGNVTGFSSGAAGLSSSTYSSWANWTAKWVQVSQTDLIRRWRKAATFTHFINPTTVPEYDTGKRMGYYMPYEVYSPLEESLESQNDNLGNDIASKDGKVQFRGTDCTWVPKLDADTDVPVFGVNWGTFHCVFLDGFYMKQFGPDRVPGMHNVIATFIDCTYQFCCKDRRRQFCLAKAADNA